MTFYVLSAEHWRIGSLGSPLGHVAWRSSGDKVLKCMTNAASCVMMMATTNSRQLTCVDTLWVIFCKLQGTAHRAGLHTRLSQKQRKDNGSCLPQPSPASPQELACGSRSTMKAMGVAWSLAINPLFAVLLHIECHA